MYHAEASLKAREPYNRKQGLCRGPKALPRVKSRALDKATFAESWLSAKVDGRQNTLCRGPGRRQRQAVGKIQPLPRAGSRQNWAVGKISWQANGPPPAVSLCREPSAGSWQSIEFIFFVNSAFSETSDAPDAKRRTRPMHSNFESRS
jgi:hypothetical protein